MSFLLPSSSCLLRLPSIWQERVLVKSKQMSVSKETVVMRRWESETWKELYIVDTPRLTQITVRPTLFSVVLLDLCKCIYAVQGS